MPRPRRPLATAVLVVLAALLVATLYAMRTSEVFPPTQPQTTTEVTTIDPVRAASARERDSATTDDRIAKADTRKKNALKDITFDNIKLDMQKGDPYEPSLLTSEIKDLDGRQIRLRGYILPSFQQSGIKQFVLVRDNLECCFGPGAAIYDCVLVEMVDGATTDFTVRPVTVEGTFTISELKDPDGNYLAIYHIDGRTVK